MRRGNLDELAATAPTPPAEGPEEQNARALMEERFGPSCAAWLAFAHRRQLRTAGAVDFIIPGEAELPYWFALAVACLRTRQRWSVDKLEQRGARTYRVRWHGRKGAA